MPNPASAMATLCCKFWMLKALAVSCDPLGDIMAASGITAVMSQNPSDRQAREKAVEEWLGPLLMFHK